MQALTPILINLLWPRGAGAQENHGPSAFAAGYLDETQDEYCSAGANTHHERRLRQARRHHSTGASYGQRSSLRQLVDTEGDGQGVTPRRNSKRMSLDTFTLHNPSLKQPQRQRLSRMGGPTSISDLPPLASPRGSSFSHRASANTMNTAAGVATTTSTASTNSSHRRRHVSNESAAIPSGATTTNNDYYYQPGDEHERLAESEFVIATSSSSPRPSTCSMTSSFSSSSSSYSSLCEPLTPTTASYSHYHSNDHFRKQPLLDNAPYTLSDKDMAAVGNGQMQQPYFVNLASHQWSALDDE